MTAQIALAAHPYIVHIRRIPAVFACCALTAACASPPTSTGSSTGSDGGATADGTAAGGGDASQDGASDGTSGPSNDVIDDSDAMDTSARTAADVNKGPCTLPTKWGPALQKMASLALFAKGEGCDLDGDGKPDNQLGAIKGLAGKAIDHSVSSGDVKLVLEALPFATDGTPFELRMLSASLDATNTGCALNTEVCSYTVGTANYDTTTVGGVCGPYTSLKSATIKSGQLAGGGNEFSFVIPIPLGDIKLEIPFHRARISGTVTGTTTWEATTDGKLCGVLPKAALLDALNKVPPEQLASIGGKEAALGLLDSLLPPDLDIDGDGTLDGVSAGFAFTSIGAKVTGISP